MARIIAFPCECGVVHTFDDPGDVGVLGCEECGADLVYDPESSFMLCGKEMDVILSGDRIEIGRSGPKRVIIDDPKLSRHHSTLNFFDSGYTLTDHGSLNGTTVNDRPLRKNIPVRLYPGDLIRLSTIEFEYLSPEAVEVDRHIQRPVSSRRPPPGRRSTPPGRSSGAPLGAIVAILIVFLALGIFAFLYTRKPALEPRRDARVSRPVNDPLTRDSLPISEYEKTDFSDAPREGLPEEPIAESVKKDFTEPADQPAQAEGERPREVPELSEENRLFTLSLSGDLGGRALDASDTQTWGRLGFFLQQETQVPFFLVYPGGSIPIFKKRDEKGKEGKLKRDPFKGGKPKGDRSSPTFRLIIHAVGKDEGPIEFFGEALSRKYTCTISCRIEKMVEKKLRVLKNLKVHEKITPALKEGEGVGEEGFEYIRKVYDLAIEKLTTELLLSAPFR